VNTALDTNILIRYVTPSDQLRPVAIAALTKLQFLGHQFVLLPQNHYEFWVVATRALSQNRLGLSPQECDQTLLVLEKLFPLLADQPNLIFEWRKLVVAHNCIGKPAHDARLVAAMSVHGIRHLLTFNTTDFQRYPHLTLHDPRMLALTTPATP
jgi:predicted nucleic acid-binding protein